MTRLFLLAMILGLPGCAAIPVAGWVAIGAIAGTVTEVAKLDETAIDAYLSLKGKKIALKPVPVTP